MAFEYEWVETDARLESLVRQLLDEPRYALDTEFHREGSYYPQPALVQLAWRDGFALIDPLRVDLRNLASLIEGPGLAVLHAAGQDLELLRHSCGALPTTLFDTQIAASFVGFSTPSLETLVRRVLGVEIPKASRLTDWLVRPLRPEQREYAVADVAYLFELTDTLSAVIDKVGRTAWVRNECTVALSRALQPPDPDDAWLRIKECRTLRGAPNRGVAKAVAAWRERRARSQDLPVRSVLADLAVIAIANRPPSTRDELLALRGVDGRVARGSMADEILAAVATGGALPPESVVAPTSDDLPRHLRPAATLAGAWIAQLGHHLGIDPVLLATRSDVAAYLSGAPDARLRHGWRASVLSEPLTQLAAGDVALALDAEGGLVLERRSHEPAGPAVDAAFEPPW